MYCARLKRRRISQSSLTFVALINSFACKNPPACGTFLWLSNMSDKVDVWQGTLALMILKTLETIGPLHGYGIARRIEQTSANHLVVNYGTIYPALLKLEQEGYIDSEWGASDNNRKAKFYRLTRTGRKQLQRETREWERTVGIVARFFEPHEESS